MFSITKVASLMAMMMAVAESSSSSMVANNNNDQFSLYFSKSALTNTTKPAGCLHDPSARSCTIVAQNVALYQQSEESGVPAGHLRSVCRKHAGLSTSSFFGGEEVPSDTIEAGDIHCVYIFEFEGTDGQLGMDGYLKMNNTEFLPATLYENYGTNSFEDIVDAEVNVIFNNGAGDLTGRFTFSGLGDAAPSFHKNQPRSIDLTNTATSAFAASSTLASL